MKKKRDVAESFEEWLDEYVETTVDTEIKRRYPKLLQDLEEQRLIHATWNKRREAQGKETGKNMSYSISYSSYCAELQIKLKEKEELIVKLQTKCDKLTKQLKKPAKNEF